MEGGREGGYRMVGSRGGLWREGGREGGCRMVGSRGLAADRVVTTELLRRSLGCSAAPHTLPLIRVRLGGPAG